MNGLKIPKLLIFILLILIASPVFPEAVPCKNFNVLDYADLSQSGKKKKVKKPVSAKRVQKQQEAKKKKKDKEYANTVRENRKHSLEIQTPAVRERMKQNVKDANANYNAKKKYEKSNTKRGSRKYK